MSLSLNFGTGFQHFGKGSLISGRTFSYKGYSHDYGKGFQHDGTASQHFGNDCIFIFGSPLIAKPTLFSITRRFYTGSLDVGTRQNR